MLKNLTIENYALISELNIPFHEGLTIITGETGAGKSIMLGALALILGKRADVSVLYDKNKKCIVEGIFDISRYNLQDFFAKNDLDYDEQVIIRREIAATGKSRAFINDLPVTLEILTELGNQLIDIHSQHQHLSLSDHKFQMKVVDSFAHTFDLLSEYQRVYKEYYSLKLKLNQLQEDAEKSKADLDYFTFQHNQLKEAHLKNGEQEEIELELEKLTHAKEIKSSLMTVYDILTGESSSLITKLKDAIGHLSRIQKYLPAAVDILKRIESAYIDLKDMAGELEIHAEKIDLDPARLELVKGRLDMLYSLMQKHRKSSVSELIELQNELEEKIQAITSYDFRIDEATQLLKEKTGELKELALKLSELRTNAFHDIESQIISMLREMGMPSASFYIEHKTLPDYSPSGVDQIQFMFSANKNIEPQEISKVASGGELSRLMLSIKSLLSDATGLPTIIFDEIDTGVSGEIAEKMGNIIKRMAERMQLINITHLPQIASKGHHHLLVYKAENEQTTVTKIKELTSEERHIEIAKMLSGEEITAAAMENARELLKN